MLDFAAARRMMVDCQVRTSDVTDLRLIAAMLTVPRERFAPKELAELAYLDADLPVEAGRRLMKPMVLSKLLQAAEIGESDRVLIVGCASGYSAAVIEHLAGSVVALEEDADLAQLAKAQSAGAWGAQRHGGDRPAGRGLARCRSLRCDSSRRCRRGSAASPASPADRRRAPPRRGRPTTSQQGHAVPFNGRRIEQPTHLRCHGAGAAWLCQAPRLCVLGTVRKELDR